MNCPNCGVVYSNEIAEKEDKTERERNYLGFGIWDRKV